ncbi:phosphopantetheine-binding protein [Nocardia sp. NPDC004604]|uniref:acyl carrier protein n=1 Tax=Nocardia sp. NPDC004604 TaxID=3157013 RepID=UPI0033A37001
MRAEDLTAVVITSVADAIGLEKIRIHPESTLIGDLGAESIDLPDIWFRIHRDSGVEISGDDVAALLRGDIPDDEFGGEAVSEMGLAHLERVLPQFNSDSLTRPLRSGQVLELVTVGNLLDLVHRLAAQERGQAESVEVGAEL